MVACCKGGMALNVAALISSHLERYLVPPRCKEQMSTAHTCRTLHIVIICARFYRDIYIVRYGSLVFSYGPTSH